MGLIGLIGFIGPIGVCRVCRVQGVGVAAIAQKTLMSLNRNPYRINSPKPTSGIATHIHCSSPPHNGGQGNNEMFQNLGWRSDIFVSQLERYIQGERLLLVEGLGSSDLANLTLSTHESPTPRPLNPKTPKPPNPLPWPSVFRPLRICPGVQQALRHIQMPGRGRE